MIIDLEIIIKIYFYTAIIGTFIFILKSFIPIELGGEVDTSFNSLIDCDSSFNLFTLESISAFFMTSGWLGWVALKYLNYSLLITLSISLISGFIAMFLYSFLILQIKKLEHVPQENIEELLNKTGKTYLHFAPNGNSKIEIEFNSKLTILDATNNTNEEIPSFTQIKVVKIENNQIFIEKVN